MTTRFSIAALVAFLAPAPAAAQPDAAALFTSHCAMCHEADVRAPDRETLKLKTPDAILASMVSGTMAIQARGLSAAERRSIAAFLGTREPRNAVAPEPALCAPSPFRDPTTGPRWTTWGGDPENTRFQKEAGVSAADVPKLKLKWAFGFPEATVAYSQAAVAGGRVFVGSATGVVYSLDAKTGCAHWSYAAPAAVRTAIAVGAVPGAAPPRHAVFFGDLAANVHALDASTGAPLWTRKLDAHAAARITGAPVLHGNRVYVPVSSWEEGAGAKAGYECCTFRGSVAALDAASGNVIWQTYTIADAPRPTRKTPTGTQLHGPSGAAVTSDDGFVVNCREGNSNCPEAVGPDFDFGSSPILRRPSTGQSVLIAGQKSGVAYGLDPDKEGAILWEFRAGKRGPLGGIEWGMAADEEHVYIPISDLLDPAQAPRGLFAVRIDNGEKVWHAPAPTLNCTGGRGCVGAQSAAITAIPGIVFAGSIDGRLRAYSTRDGSVVWAFDTAREFETVNRVKANGGSIDAAGAVVVDGMLFTNSGYGQWRGKAGNVLLAFEVEK